MLLPRTCRHGVRLAASAVGVAVAELLQGLKTSTTPIRHQVIPVLDNN
jgi:hypothetical protein